jgi:hypothetical protein
MCVSEIIKPEKNYQRAGLIMRAFPVIFGMGYRAPNFSFFVFFFFFFSLLFAQLYFMFTRLTIY